MTDDELIEAYLEGEPGAFAEVDSWIRPLTRRSYVGLRHEHDDLVQSVHERLLESLRAGRFAGRSALRTYVHGIVHRTAIAGLRRRYRDRALQPVDDELPGGEVDNPYRRLESRDERALVRRVLFGMPAACRELWKLVFVDRLSYEETGRRLAVPEGTVKSRMWYCRRRAADALKRAVGR